MADFNEWLEAWTSGFNAHRDSPDLTEDGFALLTAAQRAWENSGGEQAKRVFAAPVEVGERQLTPESLRLLTLTLEPWTGWNRETAQEAARAVLRALSARGDGAE